MGSEEIDITDLSEMLRSSFVLTSVFFLTNAIRATPLVWLTTLPLVRDIFNYCLTWSLEKLSQSFYMKSFFFNTALRKATDAIDFVEAVRKKEGLSDEATDDVYEMHEFAQMREFGNLVRLRS